MIEKIIKILLLVGVFYIIYRLKIHEKVFKLVNQFIGNTTESNRKVRERKRYMKKLLKQMKHSEEI